MGNVVGDGYAGDQHGTCIWHVDVRQGYLEGELARKSRPR